MAREKVIVKRLAAIENFGSMNVLCSDKTGTLTEGVVHLHSALNVNGYANEKVLLYAYIKRLLRDRLREPHRRRHPGLSSVRPIGVPEVGLNRLTILCEND